MEALALFDSLTNCSFCVVVRLVKASVKSFD
jgi:hypothetical protein